MPRTEQEKREFELQCYGCTEQDLEEELNEMFGEKDPTFYAVCILSDVQELMARVADGGMNMEQNQRALERARMYVNKAKWFCRYEANHKREAI